MLTAAPQIGRQVKEKCFTVLKYPEKDTNKKGGKFGFLPLHVGTELVYLRKLI